MKFQGQLGLQKLDPEQDTDRPKVSARRIRGQYM